ncbi:alpha-keto acid decarboxylase family protein, partial [Francisella tularensis subsp. holarctica]|uniref:thiamine pyrophosphate-binding protein n=1 Tax=Francisella tularensis TaxID=263 RepID=UPI0023AE12A7|nr:alpha-keto acid decarboxylase family protein [Francisella tularensis subsp. holarctica]
LNNNSKLNNEVNANELNAIYAPDGYVRVKGAAILSTTYAVGELIALNGVMGSKAENLVVFHLVGSPGDGAVGKKRQVLHTLGDGVLGN